MNVLDAREYTAYWFSKKKLKVNERGLFVNNARPHELLCAMQLDYTEDYNEFVAGMERNRPKPVTLELLKLAFQEQINAGMEIARIAVRDSMKFCGKEDFTLHARFIKALCGIDEPNALTVLKHWMWMLKRNQWNLPLVDHIMPILYGKTGSGKSTAVKALLGPIKDLIMDTSLTAVLNPEKFGLAMSTNSVALLDEMSGAGRVEIEALKRQITAIWNDIRIYHTQNVIKVKQNVVFIGTSNKPVAESLYDITGMRRFFELACQDKMDWTVINSLDYMAMWQAIDENKEGGYLNERATEIAIEQQKLVGIDDIAAFFEAADIDPNATDVKFVLSTDIYTHFSLFCDNSGITKPDNAVWFGRKLKGRGIKSEVRRVGKKTLRGYYIDAKSSIHGAVFNNLDEGAKNATAI